MRRAALPAAVIAAFVPTVARAQGSLSVQGFGYPPGELSTRALGMGGGLAEFDPISPINPAAVTDYGRTTVGFQYDPEFRTTTVGGATAHNTIARFPIVGVGVPFGGGRYTLALTASTFLDRSFTTTYKQNTVVGSVADSTTEDIESRGSVADLRAALGVYVTRWLRLGIAAHRLTGDNRLVSGRTFTDTTQFGSVSDSSTLSYSGSMLSAGAELTPVPGFTLAGSVRHGGALDTRRNDTTLTRGNAPDRYGVGLRIDRVTGATFAVSYARTTWSRMRSLGSTALDVRDTEDLMGGVEALGPSVGTLPLVLRLGGRRRTLPFGIGGAQIRETAFSGGVGLPLARGRALADLTLQRATRTPEGATVSGVQDAREHAYTLSLGFTLRP